MQDRNIPYKTHRLFKMKIFKTPKGRLQEEITKVLTKSDVYASFFNLMQGIPWLGYRHEILRRRCRRRLHKKYLIVRNIYVGIHGFDQNATILRENR